MKHPLPHNCRQLLEYRGYCVFERITTLTGTVRAKGLDGKWRKMIPTPYGAMREFVIARRNEDGHFVEVTVGVSEVDAKRTIDQLIAKDV